MKKSKLIKLLVSALSLCLLIGAMVGITAMAEDEGSETTPYVLSKNVSYGDKLYLFYAVPTASFPEGATNPQLAVYDADDNFSYFVDYAETKTIFDEECYVFNSSGVAAKEINTVEKVIPCYTDAEGNVVYGEAATYSVEDYLLQKLYKEGYAVDGYVNDEDGLADERRTLYYSMLKYGATAQALLAPDAAVKIGSVGYVSAPASNVTMDKNDEGYKRVYLSYDQSKIPSGKVFISWTVYTFDAFGNQIGVKENIANGTGIAIEKSTFMFAVPVYEDARSFANSSITVGTTTTSGNIHHVDSFSKNGISGSATVYAPTDVDNYASVVSDANGLTLTQTVTGKGNSNIKFNMSAADAASTNFAVFEADVTFALTVRGCHFYFDHGSESDKTGMYFTYMNSLSGGVIGVVDYDNNAAVASSKTGYSINNNEKVKLRIEYFEADTKADILIRVYLDGVLVSSSTSLRGTNYATDKPVDAGNVNRFGIGFNNGALGSITFDNVCLAHANIEKPATPVGNDTTSILKENGTVSYASGLKNNAYITTTSGEKSSNTLYYDKNGAAVLHSVKTEATSSGTSGSVSINALTRESEANANKVICEYDLFANSYEQIAHYVGGMYTNVVTMGDASRVYVDADNESGSGSTGEWLHVKIEYTAVQSDEDKVVDEIMKKAVYGTTTITITNMDGEVVSTGSSTYAGQANKIMPLVSEVTSCHFSFQYRTVCDIYTNNFELYKVYDASLDAAE